jgi:predicted nucleotidyltransferase
MLELQGKNEIGKFRKMAESLVTKIVAFKGVTGVVFIGGLVRGFADKYSDVDMLVFLSEKDEDLRKRLRKIGVDEQKRSNVDIDLEVHFFEDFSKPKWSEMSRWDFSHAKIVYDSEGKIRKLFKQRLRVPKSFWIKRAVIYSEYLKWYCCPPKESSETMVDAWIARGDMVSAQYCVNYGLDLMLNLLFALNKEFLPPQKWRLFYSYSLKWLPKDYVNSVREIMIVKDFTKHDVDRRLRVMKTMWQQVLSKLKSEMNLTPKLISKYYLEKMLHQT